MPDSLATDGTGGRVASARANNATFPVDVESIRTAHSLLTGQRDYLPGQRSRVAFDTPLVYCEPLSHQLGCRVWLKLENLQRTGSYKIRGAFNNVASLPPDQRSRGLITASAGNHAQGVAAAAAMFGIADRTTIFVPIGTPKVKQENTRAYGVEVRETGENFDRAREAAYVEAKASGRAFIEPFDDWNTIAGQGTVGLEIAEALPQCRAIFGPVGGGGLISGIAIAARGLLPDAAVIGAQAAGSPAMIISLDHGEVATLPYPPSTQIADGIKVSRPGNRPFEVVQALLGRDRLVAVSDIETVAAAADLMVYAKVIAEGAGAVSVGALREVQMGRVPAIDRFGPDDDVVAVVSGGNIDPSFSWRILYEQTVPNLMTVRVAMPDRPGELLRMLVPIAKGNVNIIDVDVNRLDARPRMGERIVEVCVAIANQAQADSLIASLNAAGYRVLVSRWQDPAIDTAGNTLPSVYAQSRDSVNQNSRELPDRPGQAHELQEQGLLLIVNKKRPLPADYVPGDLRLPDMPRLKDESLKRVAADALEAMFESAGRDGVGFRLLSGYRPWQQQLSIYEDSVVRRGYGITDKYIARPGHSEHQTGLAADLGDGMVPEADLIDGFAETPAGIWLSAHAAEFGFHLRYPAGKEEVTGIAWESWHFRFVGRQLAERLKSESATLEEYFGVEGGEYLSPYEGMRS